MLRRALFVILVAGALGSSLANAQAAHASRYDDLVALFTRWREFQHPPLVDGVPDYRAAAMAAQARALPAWQRRLIAIDTVGWTIAQRVDWHIVRAEMSGLDFDHRVLRPWANDPAFYASIFLDRSDQPAREGPHAYGFTETWSWQWPLSDERSATLSAALRHVPQLLAQARTNLVGNGHDLWQFGAREIRGQSASLAELDGQLASAPASLRTDLARARAATDSFASWVEATAKAKTGHSGVGTENYDWYLRNVQLVPYTWRDEVTLMQRELARARSSLALEEQRNRALPAETPVASADEHKRRFVDGVHEYVGFLRDHRILDVQDWMEPALLAQVGRFSPGPREFFTEVDYRDPEVMRTHGYHWFDLGRMEREPHVSPIRRGPLLYNIFNTRTEGHATGWEEMMLHAGMFDARPRTRELIWILLAQRAARALGDLHMHANELTLEQAATSASRNTPRNWLRLDANTVRGEQTLYLEQPAYGTSYVIGKIEIERLLETRARQLGDRFTMRDFMREFDAAGLIPATLLRWELTGVADEGVLRVIGGSSRPARD